MRPPPALVEALRVWAEHALDREPPPRCCLCDSPATSASVFLAEAPTAETWRGCVLPICGMCLCAEDFQARIALVLREEKMPWM
jgi:hypothetical protein